MHGDFMAYDSGEEIQRGDMLRFHVFLTSTDRTETHSEFQSRAVRVIHTSDQRNAFMGLASHSPANDARA